MLAARFHVYGDPDVLNVEEVAMPTLGPTDVLVRVHGSSLNKADIGGRQGTTRLIHARHLPYIPGYDLSGEVVACGPAVTAFAPGERVYGMVGLNGGAQAEYASVAQEKLARAPRSMPLHEAAAVPLAGLTALQALRGKARIQPGQRLLVNGAAGGVGTFGVQLGRVFGCNVTAVCHTSAVDAVAALGADEVIDYTKTDFATLPRSWDVVFDAAGNKELRDVRGVLAPGGLLVAPRPSPASIIAGGLRLVAPGPRFAFLITRASGHDLALLTALIDEGRLSAVIDQTFPLAQVREAHRHFEAGHLLGKVVVQVAEV